VRRSAVTMAFSDASLTALRTLSTTLVPVEMTRSAAFVGDVGRITLRCQSRSHAPAHLLWRPPRELFIECQRPTKRSSPWRRVDEASLVRISSSIEALVCSSVTLSPMASAISMTSALRLAASVPLYDVGAMMRACIASQRSLEVSSVRAKAQHQPRADHSHRSAREAG